MVGEIGYRLEPESKDQTVYIRPAIQYSPNRIINFTLGVANFNTWRSFRVSSIEFRTFQFVKLRWPRIGNFQFTHRIGLEQRMFYFKSFEFNSFAHRARYYVDLKSPSITIFNIKSPFYFILDFELLTNINSNNLGKVFDHNRFTLGIGNKINNKFRAEIKYKVLSFVDPALKDFVREIDVIRIRLYWQF